MQKRLGKVIVINSKNEILLVKRGSTAPSRPLTWEVPGGIVEKGETDEEGAIRELFEEAGIEADKLTKIFTKRMTWGNIWTFYYFPVDSAEVRISWEHDEYRWQPLTELDKVPDIPDFYYKDLIKALKQIDKPTPV